MQDELRAILTSLQHEATNVVDRYNNFQCGARLVVAGGPRYWIKAFSSMGRADAIAMPERKVSELPETQAGRILIIWRFARIDPWIGKPNRGCVDAEQHPDEKTKCFSHISWATGKATTQSLLMPMTALEDLNPSFRPGRAFQLFTGLLLAVLAVALAFGLTHQSSKPAVLGRYSIEYSMLLAILLAAIGALARVLLRPKPATVRWAGNIYTALVSTAVAVAVAEIGLRVVNPWGIELFSTLPYHMQGMVDHPLLGYAHPKSVAYQLGNNRVSLNSNGHRGDEMPVRKPAGERRILILGDSVAFGWGVNQGEEFPARLETLLREQNNVDWRVINSGVNGYNSQQEAIFFATEGIAYEPDIVVLVYVDNDVEPVINPKPVTWRRYPTWPSSLPELLERGLSLSYLYQTTKLFQRVQEREMSASTPVLSVTRDVRWPDSLNALRTILDSCRSHGIPFLLVTESSSDVDFFLAMKQVGIDAISFGPAWQKVPAGQHFVSRVDPHPSARVHSEFAKLLLEELRKRGWLETRSAP